VHGNLDVVKRTRKHPFKLAPKGKAKWDVYIRRKYPVIPLHDYLEQRRQDRFMVSPETDGEQVSMTAAAAAAATAVLNTYELLENILMFVPEKPLLRIMRTAKRWYDIGRESPGLQKLFARPPVDKTQPWILEDLDFDEYAEDATALLYEGGFAFPEFEPHCGGRIFSQDTQRNNNFDWKRTEITLDNDDKKKFKDAGVLKRYVTTPPAQAMTACLETERHNSSTNRIYFTIYGLGGLTIEDLFEVAKRVAISSCDHNSHKSWLKSSIYAELTYWFDEVKVVPGMAQWYRDDVEHKKASTYVEGLYPSLAQVPYESEREESDDESSEYESEDD